MTDEIEVTATAEPSPIVETPAIEGEGSPTPPEPEAEPRTRRDSIEKAFADLDAPEGDKAPKAEPTTDAQGRRRNPDGKFASKEPEAEKQPETEDKTAVSEAPSRFSPDAKAAWKDAPASVQGEIKRAITELESGLAQKDAQLEPLKPYFEMAQKHGVTVDGALGNYVRMEQLLSKDLRGGLTALAQNFGMTLDDMIAKATGQQSQSDAKDREILDLRNQVQNLSQQVTGVSQTVQKNNEDQIYSQIEAFAAEHDRFDELSSDISRLLQTGYAKTLDEAYGLAERLNPAPQPDPPAPAETAQPRQQLSVTGAPNAGSNPGSRKPSRNRTEALQRAFSGVGLT